MIKFIKQLSFYSFVLIFFTLLIITVYSNVFQNDFHNKIVFNKSFKNTQFDYLVIGNSRALTSLDLNELNTKNNLKGLNISLDGSNLFEQHLLLKDFLETNNCKKVYFQVDPASLSTFDKIHTNKISYSRFIPFLTDFDLLTLENNHLDFFEFNYYYNPFTVLNKYLNFEKIKYDSLGSRYYPVNFHTTLKLSKPRDYKLVNFNKERLRKIISTCDKHSTELIFFTAPFYDNFFTKDDIFRINKIFKKFGVRYHDYSGLNFNKDMFFDSFHLNFNGVKKFTKQFIL